MEARLRASFAPLHTSLATTLRSLAAQNVPEGGGEAAGAAEGAGFGAEVRAVAGRAKVFLAGGSKLLVRHHAALAQTLQVANALLQYKSTSLIRNRVPLKSFSRSIPHAQRGGANRLFQLP